MLSLPELKAIMKANNIKGCTYYNKNELLTLLGERGLIPNAESQKPEKPMEPDQRYDFLKNIRKQPRQTEIMDLETGEVKVYPSMYKASRALKVAPSVLKHKDGKILQQRYKVNILKI